ncbi:hypothetical protein [Halomonas borealis]|nr:hypothetical protein [Halomonas borealis]
MSKVFEAFLLTIAMAFPGKTVAAFTGMSDYPGFNLNWFSL